MAENYALRDMVEQEQQAFVALLQELTPEQWESPSLCEGWSVRDTVIHSAWHAHFSPRQRFGQLLRVRLSEDRLMEPDRARPTSELIAWMAAPAIVGGRQDILTQLSELVIHQQDVRRPLGLVREIPAEPLALVLDFGVSFGALTATMAFSRKRAKGLRLVATDVGWWSGSGPEVRGPGEAMLMALNGRAGAVDELTGEGASVLAARIKA